MGGYTRGVTLFLENWFLHLRDIYIQGASTLQDSLWGYLGGFFTFRELVIVQCVLYMYQDLWICYGTIQWKFGKEFNLAF